MFCKYCGKEIEDGKEVCDECMKKEESNVENATNTNEELKEGNVVEATAAENASSTDKNTTNNNATSNEVVSQPKSKLAAGLFGIFLGMFGVHNFYLGYTGKAVAQLLITVLSCFCLSFVSAIWGLIEGILILAGDISTDAYGNKLKND